MPKVELVVEESRREDTAHVFGFSFPILASEDVR